MVGSAAMFFDDLGRFFGAAGGWACCVWQCLLDKVWLCSIQCTWPWQPEGQLKLETPILIMWSIMSVSICLPPVFPTLLVSVLPPSLSPLFPHLSVFWGAGRLPAALTHLGWHAGTGGGSGGGCEPRGAGGGVCFQRGASQ
jgi:hypothetical protein